MPPITLDYFTFFVVATVFIPFFCWRSIVSINDERWGKVVYCFVISLFVLRLAYLRVATNSGRNGFENPANFSFTKELGDPLVFLLCVLLLFAAMIYRLADDAQYIKKTYIRRADLDKEVNRQVEEKLKQELLKRGLA
jgi:hypothetical protein